MKKRRWGLILYILCVAALLVLAGLQLSSFLNLWTHRGTSVTEDYRVSSVQETDQMAGILRPLRIYAASGENRGRCSLISDRTGHYSGLYEDSWQFLCQLLQNDADVSMIQSEEIEAYAASCRYTYAAELSAEMLKDQTGWTFSSDFAFHELMMVPAQRVKESACIYLINEEKRTAMRIASRELKWQSEANSRLLERMQSVCAVLGENYLQTEDIFAGRFSRSLYLRDQNEPETIGYWTLRPAFEQWSEDECRKAAEHYFEFPELIRSESYQNDAWIFTDDRCTVRVKQNGMIDYVKTPAAPASTSISAARAYEIAWAFLQEDLNGAAELAPGVYLEDYEKTREGHCFYFNYKINDREVLPEEELLNEEGMRAAAEIEIKNNEVSRYRRLYMAVEQNPYRMRVIKDSAVKAIDRMTKRFPELSGISWHQLRAVYRISAAEAALVWQLTAGEQIYYEEVQ